MNAHITEVSDGNFEQEVLKANEPVLVDFWAAWCAPCRMIAPTIDQIATDYQGKAKIVKLNVDENPEIAGRFGVRSIPTLLVFKGGQIVDKQVGAVPKSVLSQKLEAQIA